MHLSWCQVRVDVSARNPGMVQAALTENRRSLIELVLEPLSEEQYYEVRLWCPGFPFQFFPSLSNFLHPKLMCLFLLQLKEPVTIMSLVKSPIGMMFGFMLFVMFVMPKLAENVGEYCALF